MNVQEFSHRLRLAKEQRERGKELLQKKEQQKALELEKRKEMFKEVWQCLQPIINTWEPSIIQYLNILGEHYWGEGNYSKCEKISRKDIKLELRNMCVSQTHKNLEILWYIEGKHKLTGFERRFPIFGVQMIVQIKQRNQTYLCRFSHYLLVVDYVNAHQEINFPEQLQEALIKAVTNGPTMGRLDND